MQGAAKKFWSGETVGLRERTKRDFSTPQTDTFAGTKVEEKASVCFGRNDKFAAMLTGGEPCVKAGRHELLFD
jgi:hypothetical protein